MPNSGMIRGCSSRLLTHVRGGRSIKQQRSVSLSDSPGDLFATPEVPSSYCASRNFDVHPQKQEFWTRLKRTLAARLYGHALSIWNTIPIRRIGFFIGNIGPVSFPLVPRWSKASGASHTRSRGESRVPQDTPYVKPDAASAAFNARLKPMPTAPGIRSSDQYSARYWHPKL